MSAQQRELISSIQSVLDTELTDPVRRRRDAGKTWIFDHFPEYSQGNTLPRIGIHRVTSQHPLQSIGSPSTRDDADIQVSVLVREGKSYDIDSDGSNEPHETVLDYLTRQAKEVVEDNQSEWRKLDGVKFVIPVSSDTVRPEGESFVLDALTLDARIEDTDPH